MSSLLSARGLTKIYQLARGEVVVLRDCDFDLAEGEAIAIIGPSGAGKSTLLNLLCGLDDPTAGRVSYADRPLELSGDKLAAWRRHHVGFVFQFHFLMPDFSALENLLIPLRMHGPLGPGDESRALSLLDRMGLADRADHLPGELSGGEQQRVAVARAFMNGPSIVMADEPFGNLDREKGRQLSELLFELRAESGCALIIVTHDLELASRADRVLEIRDSGIRPAEVLS